MTDDYLRRIAEAVERLADHFAPATSDSTADDVAQPEPEPWWKAAKGRVDYDAPLEGEALLAAKPELSAVEALTIRLAYGEIVNPGALRMTQVEIDRLKAIADRFS